MNTDDLADSTPQEPSVGPGVDLDAEVAAFFVANDLGPQPTDLAERFTWLVDFQRRLHDAGLAVVGWPGVGRAGPRPLRRDPRRRVARQGRRARSDQLRRHRGGGPGADRARHRGAAEAVALPMAGRGGVVPAVQRTRRRIGPGVAAHAGPNSTAGCGESTERRCGARGRSSPRSGLLLARTGPLDTQHRTIGAFVIDMDQPGIEVRPLVTMTGAAEFAEVVFTDAVVDPTTWSGTSQGWSVTLKTLESERGPTPCAAPPCSAPDSPTCCEPPARSRSTTTCGIASSTP